MSQYQSISHNMIKETPIVTDLVLANLTVIWDIVSPFHIR